MKCKLSEVANIKMGQSPSGNDLNTDGKGVPFLQGRKTFGRIYPTIDTWTTNPKKIGNKGSILLSLRAPVGDVNIADQDICIGRGLCSIERKGNCIQEYLYYLLLFNKQALKSKATGTTFEGINRDDLKNLEVEIPSLEIQKKIVRILSSIDRKIEANELQSRILFNTSQGIHQDLLDSFSGDYVAFNELKDLGTITMGQSPKGDSYNNNRDGLPLINGAADYKNSFLKAQKYTSNPIKTCSKNDLIFCIRATIGLLVVSDNEYCLGRGVAAIKNINPVYREYSYHIINSSIDTFKRMATGSVIIGINRDDIEKILVKRPTEDEMTKYHSIQRPIFERIENIRLENLALRRIRALLLPKLMSDEISLENVSL